MSPSREKVTVALSGVLGACIFHKNDVCVCSPLFSLKHHEDSVVTGMARVHARSSKVQYPPDPGPQWICFICVSDNHSRTKFDIFSGGDALNSYPEQIMVTSGLTQRPGPSDQGVKLVAGNL